MNDFTHKDKLGLHSLYSCLGGEVSIRLPKEKTALISGKTDECIQLFLNLMENGIKLSQKGAAVGRAAGGAVVNAVATMPVHALSSTDPLSRRSSRSMARKRYTPEQIIRCFARQRYDYPKARRRAQSVDLLAYRNKATIAGAVSTAA